LAGNISVISFALAALISRLPIPAKPTAATSKPTSFAWR
jgi:hypothetical protein